MYFLFFKIYFLALLLTAYLRALVNCDIHINGLINFTVIAIKEISTH